MTPPLPNVTKEEYEKERGWLRASGAPRSPAATPSASQPKETPSFSPRLRVVTG